MSLIHFTGKYGSGKTLMMVADAVSDPKPIYANFEIKKRDYTPLLPEMLNTLGIGSILIDEAYTWLESRLPGKAIAIYMTHILFQSRKKKLDFYLTDQLLKTIDVRFRDMVDFEVKCKAIPNYKNPEGFRYIVIDRMERVYSKYYLSIEAASKYFDYYDTNELVSSIDDELIGKISKDKSSLVDRVDDIVDEILNQGYRKITLGVVRNHVIRMVPSVPKSYVQLVYDAIVGRQALADID